ncbi:MAG: hypothetical protein ACFFDH_03315 [Promethearchaeota archaeon]
MTQLKRRIVIKGLKDKRFKRLPNKKNDLWYCLTIEGEFVPEIKTFVSGGGKSAMIYEDNIHKMVKELEMDNKGQFIDFIKCPYTYDQYIRDLIEKNIIS